MHKMKLLYWTGVFSTYLNVTDMQYPIFMDLCYVYTSPWQSLHINMPYVGKDGGLHIVSERIHSIKRGDPIGLYRSKSVCSEYGEITINCKENPF